MKYINTAQEWNHEKGNVAQKLPEVETFWGVELHS